MQGVKDFSACCCHKLLHGALNMYIEHLHIRLVQYSHSNGHAPIEQFGWARYFPEYLTSELLAVCNLLSVAYL